MSNGVNVKMGVSGVSQFKQNMKQAQNSVKTLDEQLKLNEAQFKLTGDAEKYMQEKSELLQRQIAEQKRVVAEAEKALEAMKKNGVDQNSTAFQQMQQQMLKAQTSLTNMEANLEGIGDAGQDAGSGIASMNSQLASIDQNVKWDNISEGIDSIKSKMTGALKTAWNLGQALVKNVLGAGSYADELKTLSDKTGIDVETLQRMQKTALLIDTDAETIIAAKKKLEQNMRTDEKVAGLEELFGFEMKGDQASDVEDAFWAIGDALMAMDEGSIAQNTAAMEAFGKSWEDLKPLFKAGREEYDETMDSWSVLSEKQVKNLGEMDDAYQKMSAEWETFKLTLLELFSGPLTVGMDALKDALKALNDYLATDEGKAKLEAISKALTDIVTSLTKDFDPEKAIEGIGTVLTGITDAFKWIRENSGDVVTGIKAIAAAFVAMNVASLAANLMKITSGLGLFGGGKTNVPTTNTPTVVPPTGGGGGGGDAAVATATGTSVKLGGLFGSGTGFSMMGGLSTFGPIAAMAAAGYLGAKMIGANLNDPNLNKIYGNNSGEGGLVDTMTKDQLEAVRKYWDVYGQTGSEEAMNAREDLYRVLEEGGFVNTEQAVSLIENAFDNALKENDIDGLSGKLEDMIPEMAEDLSEQLAQIVPETEQMDESVTEVSDEIREMADSFMDWWNNDIENHNVGTDTINEALENLERFQGPITDELEPMRAALDLIERRMAEENKKESLKPSDLENFRQLPDMIKTAVRIGLSEANVVVGGGVIDGIERGIRKNLWNDVMSFAN